MKLTLAIDRSVIGVESSAGLKYWMWRIIKRMLETFIPTR